MVGPRDIYRKLKGYRLSHRIHPVRRVSRVAPVPGRRVVAITFDDGPCAAPARPGSEPLTEGILQTLREHGAKGTFDIIGTTQFKYPDQKGANSGPYWNGVKYDHYPEFGADRLAGAVNHPDLVKRMVQEGHELSNHGFTHAPFGPCNYPYASRRYLPGYDAVLFDLVALDELVKDLTGIKMRLGRPAHYIDKTVDGRDAYDAYRALNYLYLGAWFDGGGWKASSGDFHKDVEDMVQPLEAALAANADSLNGAIIFHKDGYNMSSQCPALEGLRQQLPILKRYEYDIVTVSELCAMSRFADVSPDDPLYRPAEALLKAGYLVAYADNCVRPQKKITPRELGLMCVPMGVQRDASLLASDPRSQWASQSIPQMISGTSLTGRIRDRFESVFLDDLAKACHQFVGMGAQGDEGSGPVGEVANTAAHAVPGDDQRQRRALLLESLGPCEHRPATRGEAIRLLSAALVGV